MKRDLRHAQSANRRSIFPILRTKSFLNVTLVFLLVLSAGCLYAKGPDPSTASQPPSATMKPFGVPLAPGIYLANFMLLYFSNPDFAANMPAYMAPLPQEVYQCLYDHPEGCPYADMAQYFAEQALERGGSGSRKTFWPSSCQTDPKWQALSAPEYRQPDQINQPLGREKADQLARLLGFDEDMILTSDQSECMMGTDQYPPSDDYGRDIIRACLWDLTNSKGGHADIPLSSYGLSLDEQGYVRSNCAPNAPCLEFNALATDGSLWAIATECFFRRELVRMLDPNQTPFLKLLVGGVECQGDWVPPCIVETVSPGKGGQSEK